MIGESISVETVRLYSLPYDLQFFSDDKTEEPTGKKIEDTRNKGQVGKSQEFAHGLQLVAAFLMLRFFSSFMGERFIGVIRWVYGNEMTEIVSLERSGLTVRTISVVLMQAFLQMLIIVAPFFIGGFLVAFFSNGLQFKFKVTTEPLKPKLDKFNPINGFKRMFSAQSLMNLALSMAKIIIITLVVYSALKDRMNELYLLYDIPLNAAIAEIGTLVIDIGFRISLILVLVGIVDLIYHKWKFKKDIKMTKQEVKDEYKNSEGDPQIKSKQRQRMREASQRRMMREVPRADVVITNPTHLAVAIRYKFNEDVAPVVVGKGEGVIAERVKNIARENDIPIVENKSLARAIYNTVEVGDMIPPEMYSRVAEILAAIFTANGQM